MELTWECVSDASALAWLDINSFGGTVYDMSPFQLKTKTNLKNCVNGETIKILIAGDTQNTATDMTLKIRKVRVYKL